MNRKKRQEAEKSSKPTHFLIDGEVRKVDLVDRPATGDLWLAVRSMDAAQEILEKGVTDMATRTAIAAGEVAGHYETERSEADEPLTVALDSVSDDGQTETEIERDEETNAETTITTTEPEMETVQRIGVAPLTREDVQDVINEIVPDVVANTLRQLGVIGETTTNTPELPSEETTEAPESVSAEPVERAGAKMSAANLKRFTGAISSIQKGVEVLGEMHRDISGGESDKGKVKRSEKETDEVSTLDMDALAALVRAQVSEVVNEAIALVDKKIDTVSERVDRAQAATATPSSIPVDDTEEINREAGKEKNLWGNLLPTRVTQF